MLVFPVIQRPLCLQACLQCLQPPQRRNPVERYCLAGFGTTGVVS